MKISVVVARVAYEYDCRVTTIKDTVGRRTFVADALARAASKNRHSCDRAVALARSAHRTATGDCRHPAGGNAWGCSWHWATDDRRSARLQFPTVALLAVAGVLGFALNLIFVVAESIVCGAGHHGRHATLTDGQNIKGHNDENRSQETYGREPPNFSLQWSSHGRLQLVTSRSEGGLHNAAPFSFFNLSRKNGDRCAQV